MKATLQKDCRRNSRSSIVNISLIFIELDYNTKNKLKYLIESQLVKLLPKIIEEENQSMKSEMSNGFV
jgi:hypothetical protein